MEPVETGLLFLRAPSPPAAQILSAPPKGKAHVFFDARHQDTIQSAPARPYLLQLWATARLLLSETRRSALLRHSVGARRLLPPVSLQLLVD